MDLLQHVAAANQATVDLTAFSGSYDEFQIHFVDLVPATDATDLWLRVSQSGSFKSGAGNYQHARIANRSDSTTAAGAGSSSDTKIVAGISVGNAAGEGACGIVYVMNPNGSKYKHLMVDLAFTNSTASGSTNARTSGAYIADTNAIDGVQLLMSSGNITSGEFYLYGIPKS